MKITVLRQPSEKDWTLSNFESDDQTVKGVGVEDEKRDIKIHGETRIPNGTYNLSLRISPKFSTEYYSDVEGNLISKQDYNKLHPAKRLMYTPHQLIWVKDVPGFEFILLHWGNSDDDTHGCYIVGSSFGTIGSQKGVVNSRKKYMEIYPLIYRAIKKGTVTITYKDAA
jgi:hypothetical protein